jgi:hypothetical protein
MDDPVSRLPMEKKKEQTKKGASTVNDEARKGRPDANSWGVAGLWECG